MTDLHVLDELEARLKGALYPNRTPRRVARRRWLPALGGLAAATAAVVVVVLVSSGTVRTTIAAALDRAARAAQDQPRPSAIGPGQFWYTRISAVNRFPVPIMPRPGSKPPTGPPPIVRLAQRSTAETWVGLDGTVRTRIVPVGPRRFVSARDRARFLATGGALPTLPGAGDSTAQGDDRFPPELELFLYRELLTLPTEPHALYERIHRALVAAQARQQRELKDTVAAIQQRRGNAGVATI